jgi:TonB family protein
VYFYASGQVKQIVLFNDVNDDNDISVVEFYDRDGNQMIANGTGNWVNDSIKPVMFDPGGFSKITGQFKDSLKHGNWKLVEISNNKLIHSERLNKGKFISATIFNPHDGDYGTINSEVLKKIPDENYAKLKSSENFELDTTVYPSSLVYADVETIFKTVTGKEYKIQNRNAGYLYGDYSLLEFIAFNIKYPVSALEKNITGKVYVSVVIDSLGNTKNVQLIKGVHKVLDEEAMRVVKLVTNWIPALRDGKEVESTITIPVSFNIKK